MTKYQCQNIKFKNKVKICRNLELYTKVETKMILQSSSYTTIAEAITNCLLANLLTGVIKKFWSIFHSSLTNMFLLHSTDSMGGLSLVMAFIAPLAIRH